MMANRKANLYGGFSDFHAGNFLRDILREEGHDLAWLAASTKVPVEILDCILSQSNMDAELFVRFGMPLQPLFMQRVEEAIFGKQPAEAVN
jgi:hypothetical protein